MSVNITQFKDFNGAKIAPITPEAAVVDEEGNKLSDKITALMNTNFPLGIRNVFTDVTSGGNATGFTWVAYATMGESTHAVDTEVDSMSMSVDGTVVKSGTTVTTLNLTQKLEKNAYTLSATVKKKQRLDYSMNTSRYVFSCGVGGANDALVTAFRNSKKVTTSGRTSYKPTVTTNNNFIWLFMPTSQVSSSFNPGSDIKNSRTGYAMPFVNMGNFNITSSDVNGLYVGAYTAFRCTEQMEAKDNTWYITIS